MPLTTEHMRDAELAYREYVAWALLFAVREAQMLWQTSASLTRVKEVLRYVSDLNELSADDVQSGSNIETIRKLIERAENVVSLGCTQQQAQ